MKNKNVQKNLTNRIEYLDLLRILATFAVIMLHVAAQNWHGPNVNSYEWKIFNIYDSITRWCVPIFVMISGTLFLNKDYTIKNIYLKKISKLLVVFIFWSLIYLLFLNKNTSKFVIISKFLTGEHHMWFLFMLIGLYMLSPILKNITKTKKLTKYFLAVTFTLAFILPQITKLLLLFNNTYLNLISKAITTNLDNFKLTIGYTFYFVLGYYLSKTDIKKNIQYRIYFLGIIGFISTIIFTNIISKNVGNPIDIFYSYMTVNVALEALSLFVFAKYNFKTNKFLTYIGNICFGVYLSHLLLLKKLNLIFGINTLSLNPIISVPIITITIFVISLLLSAFLNTIPILKKYIV